MNYIKLETEDICNGDGLRVVLWLSGCDHRCKGCQNPQTWDVNSGTLFNKKVEQELFENLNKEYISGITLTGGDPLNKNNLDDLLKLISTIRLLYPMKTIWLYTGYTWEETMSEESKILHAKQLLEQNKDHRIHYIYKDQKFEYKPDHYILRQQIISLCDILVDGQYVDELRDLTLKFRGSSNQRLIDIQKSLEQNEVVLWSK